MHTRCFSMCRCVAPRRGRHCTAVVCGAKPLGSCSLLWSSVVDLILIYIFTRTLASACPPYRLCTPFRMPFACPLSIRQSTHHPERPSGPVYSASFVFQFLPPPAPRTLSSKKLSDLPHLSGVLSCVRVNQLDPRMPASLHLVFEALTCTSISRAIGNAIHDLKGGHGVADHEVHPQHQQEYDRLSEVYQTSKVKRGQWLFDAGCGIPKRQSTGSRPWVFHYITLKGESRKPWT
jgi:hypothetical protein